MKTRRIENIKPKIKVLVNIKIWYLNAFFNLILTQFNDLVYALKASHDNYEENITTEYYQMLEIGYLYYKFIKTLFERLKYSII